MSVMDEGCLEPVSSRDTTQKVQLSEVADLLKEARRLIEHDGTDSEWVAYLERKHDLLQRIAPELHSDPAGEHA